MSAFELLSTLNTLGVKLWVEDEWLRYSAPKGALTPTLLGELKQHKADIIAFLRKVNVTSDSAPPPLLSVARDEPLPLSFAQQRLWFLDQLEGGSAAYNIPLVWRINGPLDIAALTKSFTEIVRRHESLRTVFKPLDGAAVQVITPAKNFELPVIDLRNQPEAERLAEAQRLVLKQIDKPFDLAVAPLVRVALIWLEEESYVAVVSLHHIACDGWSVSIVLHELTTLYDSFLKGAPSPLPEPAIQYADYAHWQRQWLQGEALENQIDYWRKQLAGAPPLLKLPTDRPHPPVQTFRGGMEQFDFSPEMLDRLKALSKQSGATMFVILLSAFKTLLSRYNGERDIVVGSPIANRSHKETEPLIGFFANTLVLRTEISGDLSFRQLLGRVRKVAMGAYAHQDIPFEKLVEELKPEREPNRNPLVQVLFVLQNAVKLSLDLSGLELSAWESYVMMVRLELELHIWEAPKGIFGTFMYNADLFDLATITRMGGHFRTLLEAALTNPDQRLADLPLLTEGEKRQLMLLSNSDLADHSIADALPGELSREQINAQAQIDARAPERIHHLFEAQVERAPDAVALTFGNQRLTYRQLNAQANRLARYLQSLGVGSESIVGLCAEPSPEMAVGLLGILKAGGVVLPIDPDYPKHHLSFILADAEPSVLLSQERAAEKFSESAAQIVCLDSARKAFAQHGEENPDSAVTPESAAYLIYSGRQGLLVEHRAVCRRLRCLQEKFALNATDAALCKAAPVHSASRLEFFWPLAFGGQAVIASEQDGSDPAGLRRIIASSKISIAHFAPSELSALIDSLSEEAAAQLRSLRAVICSGEPLRVSVVEAFFRRLSCELHNFYGPVEAAGIIASQVDHSQSRADVLPIGQPTGMSVYVLDENLRLAPIGVTGEIYIGGPYLARGYWKASEETARNFVSDPFSKAAGARLFKSGDLGRRRNDGQLELLGAVRRQARIGGFRFALDEVEAALFDEPSVEECVVLARETAASGPQLAAYVVAPPPFQPERLKAHLQSLLPDYMVPRAYVPLSALPLTADGQVDEKALIDLLVIDKDLTQRWETALRSLPEIKQAAVIVESQAEHFPPLHLSDLLPDGMASAAVIIQEATARQSHSETESDDSESRAAAFSDGGPLIVEKDAPATLTEALIQTAARYADKGIVYIQPDGSRVSQTYRSLLQEAKSVLAGLRQAGLKAGDRAILQIQLLRDHFPAFWACVLGGITPVTVAIAPSYEEENAVVNKLFNTWELLGHPCILTSDTLANSLSGLKRFLPMQDARALSVNRMRDNQPDERIHQSRPEDVAFFQLTSGSTGIPKCIQITHKGIVCHANSVKQFNGYEPQDVSLNWLPMDHVVPILTCHLKDVYLGCSQVAVSTGVVLANPLAWLDLMEECKVTHAWSPNFGFKLVSDALLKAKDKTWNLSSIKFFMNAGEQVTLPVVREFLKLVEPFGVPPQAMQPAFGMAESCTCITYQNNFDCETGAHRIKKSSLSGQLKQAGKDETDAVDFIDLGGPAPGVQIRIADKDNRLLPEAVIGRLQIKGCVVTPGYLYNEAANSEAFVGEGWFNSGDLGFILNGRLTLTGREKELIIVNGANFYCYEIEDIVNQIDGVAPTFVAACGFDDLDTGTEGLALFFTPQIEGIEENLELIKSIRTRVAQNLGISPAYVIPVAKPEFPKTTSGKIQRTKLKNLLAAGHFRDVVREIDIRLENSNTIPDWFYKKTWRRNRGVAEISRRIAGRYLIFADRCGLGAFLRDELQRTGQTCVRVEAGSDFVRISADSYLIDPKDPRHYLMLLESLSSNNIEIDQFLHLWTYDETAEEVADLESLDRAQERGVYSLLFLAQALAKSKQRAIRMRVVSSYSQAVSPADEIAYEKTAILGLIKTIPQEMPWLACSHIDLPADRVEANAARILRELRTVSGEQHVAYRDAERWVPRLEKIDFAQSPAQPLAIKRGGAYLISGGLGGIGVEIAKYLLERCQARLLIVGRTPLPERSDWPHHLEQAGAVSQRIKAYQELERLGGEIIYEAADICDPAQMQQAVEKAQSRWGCNLDGALHLAGAFHERRLVDESAESVESVLRSKISGSWTLHQLLKQQRGSLFISFSSINAFFGGVAVGAYSAANSFLEGFSDWQRQKSDVRSYCLHWSQWDETGMSRDLKMKDLTRSKGYYTISPAQGLRSFLVSLRGEQHQMLIGLDGGKQHIRRHREGAPLSAQKLTAYFTAGSNGFQAARLQELAAFDRFQKRSSCDFIQIKQMPVTSTGEIDLEKLASGNAGRVSRARAMPRSELEHKLAVVWKDLLSVSRLGIHDNFFELGGHSLLAVRLIFQMRDAVKVEFPLDKVIQVPTIAGMARYIEENLQQSGAAQSSLPNCLFPIQPQGSKRPFFCVHPAGGSPLCYINLAYHLGQDRPFYGFQSPGLLDDNEPLDKVEQMASLYVEAMRAAQPTGPYLFGGWSSGGPVAFEMARILEKQNEKVGALAFLDCGLMGADMPAQGWSLLNPINIIKALIILLTFAWQIGAPRSYAEIRGLAQMVGISLPTSIRDILRRDFSSKVKFFRNLKAEMLRSIRVFNCNTRAGIKYEPAPYGGKATLFRAEQKDSNEPDPVLEDLRKFALGGVESHVIGGNHMSIILDKDGSKALAEKLGECLDRV